MSLRNIAGPVAAAATFVATGGNWAAAQWAWAIASTAGNILDPATVRGPSIGEIAAQTSSEGGPIPIVFGMSPPMTGNIIATSEPRIVKKKSSGKGGPKVATETVYRTYSIGVCEGPIGGFLRVWRNNTKVYDALDPEFNATGLYVPDVPGYFPDIEETLPSRNQKFLENARFFLGGYDQDASPDLEAVFGAGTTPSYRGLAHMVMADEDVTDMRGMVPQWTVQVAAMQSNDPFADDLLSLVQYHTGVAVDRVSGNELSHVYSGNGSSQQVQGAVASGEGPFGAAWFNPNSNTNGAVRNYMRVVAPEDDPSRFVLAGDYTMEGWFRFPLTTATGSKMIFNGLLEGTNQNPPGGDSWNMQRLYVDDASPALDLDSDHFYRVGGSSGIYTNTHVAVTGLPLGTTHHLAITRLVGPLSTTRVTIWWDGVAVSSYQNSTLNNTLGYLHTLFDDRSGYTVGSHIIGGAPFDDVYAYWDQIRITEACRYTATFTPPTAPFGAGEMELVPPTLVSVVADICVRAGVTAALIDTTDLPDVTLDGLLVTNQYPAAQAIQALGQVYKFDATKYDGKIRFIPRGGNSVATITEEEMIEDDLEIEESKRSDSIQIPRSLHLSYHDADTDALTPIKQTSERSGDRRAVGELSMQSAVVMEADLAAQTAVIAHKVMIEDQKGELRFGLPDKYIGLVPSDPIIVQWNGKSERCRIQQIDIMDGYQQCVCVRDRQSAYTSDVEGIPPPVVPLPPSRVVGPTAIMPLDIPVLRDSDDNLGLTYYVAVSGLTAAWAGAVIELSYDGGANYIDSREAPVGTIIGELISALPDHPAEYPDETNEFTVRLYPAGAELLDSTLAAMLNRANLAAIGSPADGWELINFAAVDETDPADQEWTISNLLRGRKSTATQAHAVGAMFVLLDRNLLGFEPASITDIGRTLTFRATSAGQSTDTGTVVAMVYAGKSQTERHAAYLEATRDGDDLEVTWQGVGRLGGGGAAIHGAFFTGYRVTFDDGADEIVVDTVDESLTQDVSTLSSPVTVSVQQINSLTGAGPSIEVIVA